MISKTARHAVLAVAALAELPEGEFCGAAAIAEKVKAPPNYLGKLLQSLAQSGIVESQRGLGGGFQLAKRSDEITVYDIVEPIDHVSRWEGCFLGRGTCSNSSPCSMHARWTTIRDQYLAMLRDMTVADIVNHREPRTAAH